MSEAAARNKRNRGAGKRWERDVRDGGRALGIDTEHTRDTGTKDEGDLAMRINGRHVVIEAKNAKLQPTQFLRESLEEAGNYQESRKLDDEEVLPVVFVKRAGYADFQDGLALLTVREYLRLVSLT